MLLSSVTLIMTIWMLDPWPALMHALEGRYAGMSGGPVISDSSACDSQLA